MPYIEKTGVKRIKEQLWQWYDVTQDPRIDGFNGWACKQKIYKVLWQAQEYLEKMPSYAGEEEWLEEQKFDDAVNKIKGDYPNRWSD
jgi:hypothetical protein|tara:strand:+ start:458 stop:718 length:261 start_codon:yes stop_codon:yes gene_type:complete